MATKLELGAMVSLGVSVVGGAIWIGELRSDVNALDKRVDALENRIDPLRTLKVGKGDLCMQILMQQGSAKDPNRQEQLEQQWAKEGCEGLPASARTKIPPPPVTVPER